MSIRCSLRRLDVDSTLIRYSFLTGTTAYLNCPIVRLMDHFNVRPCQVTGPHTEPHHQHRTVMMRGLCGACTNMFSIPQISDTHGTREPDSLITRVIVIILLRCVPQRIYLHFCIIVEMGWNGEVCKNDNDCPVEQFCYISKRCVDYLDCSRYNRVKGQIAAQEPLQCGPCMKGYISEILATGQETPSCKYIENLAGSDITHKQLITITVVIVIAIVLIAVLFCYKFYKRRCTRQIHESRSNNAHDIASEVAPDNSNAIAIASAPPEEERPFIGLGEKKICIPDNNNKRIIETNEYQTTVPYTIQYRRIDAYASTNNNSITNDSNSNNNLLSREITVIEVREDQSDRNIETSRIDLSDHNDDNLSNHNDDDDDTIDSASEPNNKGDKKKSSLIINQMVQQNITINLNGEEY